MSAYPFTCHERFAVFTSHGEKCYLCTRPLDLATMQVDHVVPETLLSDSAGLARAQADLGLGEDFDLNSYENWMPACGPCNRKKGAAIFTPSPILQILLLTAARRASMARKREKETVTSRKLTLALNTLERLSVECPLDAETKNLLRALVDEGDALRASENRGTALRLTPSYEASSWTDSLSLSTSALQGDESQLLGQLLARRPKGKPWLKPVLQSLSVGGGPLVRMHKFNHCLFAATLRADSELVFLTTFGFIRSWNLANGSVRELGQRRELTASGPVGNHCFVPDGDLLIRGENEGSARVRNWRTGADKGAWQVSDSSLTKTAIARDGHALSGTMDGHIILWDTESGKVLETSHHHRTLCEHPLEWVSPWVSAVAITPDGRRALSSSAYGPTLIHSLPNGPHLKVELSDELHLSAATLSADGEYALTGHPDGRVLLWAIDWERASATLTSSFGGHTREVVFVAFSAEEDFAVSISEDSTIRQWSLAEDRTEEDEVEHVGSVLDVAIKADETAISVAEDGTFRTWSPRAGSTGNHEPWPGVQFGRAVFTLNGHQALVATRQLIRSDSDHGDIRWALGCNLWMVDGFDGRVIGSGTSINVPHGKIAVSGDGRTAIAIMGGKAVCLDLRSRTMRFRLSTAENEYVLTAALSQDGHVAVTGEGSGDLHVWRGGKRERTIRPDGGSAQAMAMSLDGTKVVVAGTHLNVCDILSGDILHTIEWVGQATAVALSPNCEHVVTGDSDHVIRHWVFGGHHTESVPFTGESCITAVATDGRQIIAGEESGRVHLLSIEGLDQEET